MDECIVIFATAWGSRYGGINSFNHDFCRHLANSGDIQGKKVVCIVEEDPRLASGEDCHVTLLYIPTLSNAEDDISRIVKGLERHKMSPGYFAGHDAQTGRRAIDASRYVADSSIPVAVFHHMDYRAYTFLQGEDNASKVREQEAILRDADIVFAVGPLLKENAEDRVRGSKKTSVVQVMPGLATIAPFAEMPNRFSAITFGRIGAKTRTLKQTELAVASFGQVVGSPSKAVSRESELVVLGMSKNELEDGSRSFRAIAYEHAGKRAVTVNEWEYEDNRETLLEELRQHSVCMLLSLREGFGLAGLEAISAGIPLILSERTGLYKALTDPIEDAGLGLTYPYRVDVRGSLDDDIEIVTDRLYEISKNKVEAKRKAIELKQQLLDKGWTWENTASQFLHAINSTFYSAQAPSGSCLDSSGSSVESQTSSIAHEDNLSQVLSSEEKEHSIAPIQQNPSLKLVVDNLEASSSSSTKLEEALKSIKSDVASYLLYIDESPLKPLLKRKKPLPQSFEKVDIDTVPIEHVLCKFKELLKRNEIVDSKQLVEINNSYVLMISSQEALDTLTQEILTLRECRSRESSRYTNALSEATRIFSKIEENINGSLYSLKVATRNLFLVSD